MKRTFAYPLYFLAIPILLFITGLLYLNSSGIFFLKCVDPEYAYLFNGLMLADLKPDINFVYHPGTPMHCMIATVIRIVKIFRPGENLVTDVIRNPEIYIKSTIYSVNLLGAAFLFTLGFFTYKKTRNLILALFVQLIPFVHILGLEPLARLIPESLMLSVICLWIMLLIRMVTDPEPERIMKKYSLAFGILFGLSLADKLTFLSYALIPLFVLSGWRHKFRFMGTSIVSFLVFAFPVIFKHTYFFNWVKNIIIHTGSYGSGDRGIVHWNEFTDHLMLQFGSTPVLLISLSILTVTLVLYYIRTRRGVIRERLKINLSLAVMGLVALQYVICAKQFSYHYMLPSILLTIPIIMLSISMIKPLFPAKASRKSINLVVIIMGALILVNTIPKVNRQLHEIRANAKPRADSYLQFKKFRSPGPIIIGASYYGCSAIEYALTFGLHESGKYANYLFEKVKTIYPPAYLYFPWGKVFYEGNKEILPIAFIEQGIEYNLFIADFSDARLDEIVSAVLKSINNKSYTLRKLYYDPATAEALYTFKITGTEIPHGNP